MRALDRLDRGTFGRSTISCKEVISEDARTRVRHSRTALERLAKKSSRHYKKGIPFLDSGTALDLRNARQN